MFRLVPRQNRGGLLFAIAAAAMSIFSTEPTIEAANIGVLPTIPAVREWIPSRGVFDLPPHPRVVFWGAPALRDVAEVLADDLRELAGIRADLVAGPRPGPGDVFLAVDPHLNLGSEAYQLEIGSYVRITARAERGIFYGTRTLLQLLHQSRQLPAGRVRDWPRYPERGLMLDVARKFISPGSIKDVVRELAYFKLNYLHLRLSDNEGFRIESNSHPEIVSEQHLTKDEVRGIIEFANRYHVIVVPEIDMPGHMGAALAPHPELQLRNALGQPAQDKLDVTNPAALRFAHEILDELIALFPGPYWHAGADEYMPLAEYPLYPSLREYAQAKYGPVSDPKDAVLDFINWVDQVVRTHGKTLRVWNDELGGGRAARPNPSIIVEWWTNFSPLSDPAPPGPRKLRCQERRGPLAGNRPQTPGHCPEDLGVTSAVLPGVHEQIGKSGPRAGRAHIWEACHRGCLASWGRQAEDSRAAVTTGDR